MPEWRDDNIAAVDYWLGCMNENCGVMPYITGIDHEDMVKAWNTRTPPRGGVVKGRTYTYEG